QACGDRGHERPRGFDLVLFLMEPEQCLLDDVLRVLDGAEHPIGDRKRQRPQLVGHDPNPSRQLGWRGCQPSSRLALALDAPRMSVIITTPTSPANRRPTTFGTRHGLGAPSLSASAGNQSATGAGSSSTML